MSSPTKTRRKSGVFDISNSTLVPLEEMPRAKARNPLNFDEETLAKRERDIKAIMRDYPGITPKMIETAWDYVQSCESEEEAMKEVKSWDKLPPKKREPVQIDI